VQVAWQKFSGKLGSIKEVEKARSLFTEQQEKDGGCSLGKEDGCDVVFRHVNFSYDNKQVLHDITLTVPENSSVAIVGASGAGKTTLFDLITGLLSPQSGDISCGSVSYSRIDKVSLRSQIGYVTQEPVIFDDTVANNISLWQYDPNDKKSRERLEAAARLAHCSEFIAELENGFDSVIGEKGVKLSGGQRQRISIARELFKQPRIMIYDEATSSLDTESEQSVQQSINEMKGTRTVIIIAHRLSTIRQCDYLYVLDKGRIIEEGRYQSLYGKEGGHFRRMCLAQQL
jgi:subfamily B ATP-binding cassette protein MsbA